MVEVRLNTSIELIIAAAFLDWLVGDPKWCIHPVVCMGKFIDFFRARIEKIFLDNPLGLKLGGLLIAITLIFLSGFFGWIIERLALLGSPISRSIGGLILVISLASGLAAKNLREVVFDVLQTLSSTSIKGDIDLARKKLSYLVGRDVSHLDRFEILRALAETSSENAVDGTFAPIFWMFIGVIFWRFSFDFPGPLAFVWSFKAASTLDSMLGYRIGRLQWLGLAGARIDDLMVWLPCRLVLLTLPLICGAKGKYLEIISSSLKEGLKDDSPNSGVSEAIFANCVGVRMGGLNYYSNKAMLKPILAGWAPSADHRSIEKIFELSIRLEVAWLLIGALVFAI